MRNIIIIGGWSSQKIYFERLISLLENKNNIFYIDFNDTDANFDEKLIKLIDDNSLDTVDIIAWSMGGLVTLSAYEVLKHKINSITFMSSMAKFCKSPDHKMGWNKRIVGFMIDKLSKSYIDVLNDFNKNLLYNVDTFPFEVETLDSLQVNNLKTGLKYLVDSDFRNKISSIECKTLIIHGENDTISPLSQGEYIFENLQSNKKLLKIDNCAHMPFYSHSKLCYDALLNLWKGEF